MAYLCPQVVLNLICFELTAVVKNNVEISLESNFLTQTYKKKYYYMHFKLISII